MDNDLLTLVIVTDEKYLPHAETILKSISLNCESGYLQVHLHLVNVKPTVAQKLKTICPNHHLDFSFSNEKLSLKKIKRRTERAIYSANIRVKVMYDLMLRGLKYLFYIDVDSIVRNDLHQLFDLIKSVDLTFHEDTEIPIEAVKFKSGGIGVQNTPSSLEFFKKYNELLAQHKYRKWGIDQLNLKHLYDTLINIPDSKIRWKNLPSTFLDWNFSDSSVIWTGKGNRKKLNPDYLQEFRKYQ